MTGNKLTDVSNNIDVSVKLLTRMYSDSYVRFPFIIHHSAIDEGDKVEKNSKKGEILPYELVYAAFPSNKQNTTNVSCYYCCYEHNDIVLLSGLATNRT